MDLNIVVVVLPEDCLARTCDCDSGECHFNRCDDCGNLVDDDGITCDPRGCCFYCKAD